MLQEQIYWHQTVRMPSKADPAQLPAKVDVAVVGGGFTGLSAARALAKRGVSVAVLEAETMGWGASSRNGGMVLTGLKLGMQTVARRYGLDLARRLWQCSLEAIQLVEQIVRDEQIACGFARTGHLLAASKPAHYAALEAEAEYMDREFDHRMRLVPRSQQRSEVGSDAFHGGLVDELSAGLNPAQYVTGLALAAGRAGAVMCPGTRVTRLERRAGGFRVESAAGSVDAEKVFVATAGYTGVFTPALRRKIIPIGSFIIATERLREDVIRALDPRSRMIFDSKHYLHYFRTWDQRLIFGGRAAFFPETGSTIRRSAEILRRDMVKIFPRLREVRIEYAWGGTLDFAFDTMAHVGELDGLVYSLGYAGHGVALGTYLGQTAAEAMLEGTLKDHAFNAHSIPGAPLGLYDGWPWFLPFAGLWYRILDWIE
ncbi:MAG: FAD-binding oxidoreductase [Chloroflexota bacterium]